MGNLFDGSNSVIIMSLLVMVLFIIIPTVRIIKASAQKKKNNTSLILTVNATVVTKRLDLCDYSIGVGPVGPLTTYYAIFRLDSGEQMKFTINDTAYYSITESDNGRLTFQGTQFLEFDVTEASQTRPE